MMSGADELFDQQIHDAYESVRLSDDTQDRMLATLLAAQEGQGAQQASARETWQAPVTPVRQRRLRWWVALPVAAAIAALALVVALPRERKVNAVIASDSAASSESVMPEDDTIATGNAGAAKSEDVAAGEMAFEDAAPQADMMALEAESAEDALRAVDVYPSIELTDGTDLTVLIERTTMVEVDSQRVGELVGEGEARADDADMPPVSCTVYRLKDDDQAFAVRYEDEDTYWYCTAV